MIGQGYINMQGKGLEGGKATSFNVLLGDQRPAITDGSALWTVVDRPLRRGLTVFTGYNPVQMTMDLRFGIWSDTWQWGKTDDDGIKVESMISTLESWGGSKLQSGPPSVIYITSNNDLIPRRYWTMPWILNGAPQWGDSFSNPNGFRIRQDVTITLENYLNFNKAPKPDPVGGFFKSKQGADTALKIANRVGVHHSSEYHHTLANLIITASKNSHLRLKSIKKLIKHGTAVWIPPQ